MANKLPNIVQLHKIKTVIEPFKISDLPGKLIVTAKDDKYYFNELCKSLNMTLRWK